MRPTPIISGFLILVFATSAFVCATGWSGSRGNSCLRPGAQHACVRKKPGTQAAAGSACGHALKSLPGQCSLRSFQQFQFAEFRRFEIASPLLHARGKPSPPRNPVIIVSSVGPSETDRGPPRS